MKRFLTLIAFAAIAGSVFGTTTTLLDQDFEGLEYGDARNMRGFGTYVSANAEQFYCNVTNECVIGQKALWSGKVKKEGQSQRGGVWVLIPDIGTYTSQEGILTINAEVTCHSNMGGFGIGTGDEDTDSYAGVFENYFFANGGNVHMRNAENAAIGDGFAHTFNVLKPLTLKVICPTGEILAYKFGDSEFTPAIGTFLNLEKVRALCVGVFEPPYGANNRTGASIDNIKVTFCDDPMIVYEGETVIPFNNSDEDNTFAGAIRSILGSGEVTAEVIEGSNWLKIDGTTFKRFNVVSGQSVAVNYTIDRFMVGANTGFATVRFETSTQTLDVQFVIQSGTRGGGFSLYSTDFEEMEDGSILEQPCWVAAGTVNNCLVMEDPDDAGNRVLKIGQAQALHTKIAMDPEAYKAYDIKVSMRVKYPSEATKSTITFGTELTAERRYGEYSLRHGDDGIRFTADNVEGVDITNRADYDKWFTFSYSYNTDPANPVCRFITFDGVQYDINKPLNLSDGWGTAGYTTEIRNYTWSGSALYYIDDFKVELVKAGTVPEPAVFGLLALVALFLRRK
ncbi:hypothetical protein J6X96_08325 [bacterium]|nr:hypothetical protein [bacterium]